MNKTFFLNSFCLGKTEQIHTNRIVKDYYSKSLSLVCDGNLIIDFNDEISMISSKSVTNYINNGNIYDEIIITKSPNTGFSCINEFVFYSLLECDFVSIEILKETDYDISNYKTEISENEFKDLLGWGLFDIMNENLKTGLNVDFKDFTNAYTFFEYPSNPIFALNADGFYYMFINNYYT